MYTGTAAYDWTELRARGAQAVQRAEAGLPWEPDASRAGNDQEVWLISFVDVLTLLLTLFVLLLAYQRDELTAIAARPQPVTVAVPRAAPMTEQATAPAPMQHAVVPVAGTSEISREAISADSDAVSSGPAEMPAVAPIVVFPSLGIRAAESSSMPAQHPLLWLNETVRVPSRPLESPVAARVTDDPQSTVATAAKPEPSPGVEETPAQRLLAELDRSALAGRVEVSVLPDAVNLEISDNILFAPASAALTGGGRALLNDLATTLKTLPYALSVEGHTDNVPIRSARYPSNWELAAARASSVTRHLIEHGIAADRVRAIGYADTRPRADNLSPEGRARNRRVAFILRMPAAPAARPSPVLR